MCGIAGFFIKKNCHLDKTKLIKQMTDIIAHRGPDAEGYWCNGNIALGHRRLAVIDLSEDANQPMISSDGRFIISYNGEIYNYIEIRNELIKNKVAFMTESDTEVIIEAYRRYGGDCFAMFNGMWALVIYDVVKNELIFSRDRFGVKPLYMVDDDDCLVFASEPKAILKSFPQYAEPNMLWIYRYLSNTMKEDVDEESAYKNIKVFPPSNYGIYSIEIDKMVRKEYWRVDELLFQKKWIKGRNPYKTFRKLFDSAVGLRLRSDVEVGACLSGGLDSSAIVGCIKKNVNTFSSIYDDVECNEEGYIKIVNSKWNTISHYTRPDEEKKYLTDYINKIIWYHDGPVRGGSLYSQYKVMQKISDNVKVVLDGQGADELFAGYIHYYADYIEDLYGEDSIISRIKAIKYATILKEEWPEHRGLLADDLIIGLLGIDMAKSFRDPKSEKLMQSRRSKKLFTDSFLNSVVPQKRDIKIEKCKTRLGSRLCNDLIRLSIPSLLHNEDSNSMAFSVETRLPFLDYRIVEFAIGLDSRYKIRNQWTKWIIRKSLKDYLPIAIRKRKNKMGFPAPFARWLREGCCQDVFRDKIYSFADRGIIPYETIDGYYTEHMQNINDYNEILFRIYNLEVWYESLGEYAL